MIFKVVLDKKIHLLKLGQQATIEDLKRSISQAYKLQSESFVMFYIDEEGDDITLNDEHDFAILTSSEQKTMKIKVVLAAEEPTHIRSETEHIEAEPIESVQVQEVKPEESSVMVDESLIEEKLKKLLPGLVAKVKTQIEEEVSERSRIYDKNQPLIMEEEEAPKKAPQGEFVPILEEVRQKEEVRPKEGKMESEEEKKGNKHKGITCDGCGWQDIEGIRYKCAVCADFDFCEKCEGSTEHVHPFLKIRTVEQTPIKIIAVVKDEEDNLEVNGVKLPAQSGIENLINRGMSFLPFLAGQQQQQRSQGQSDNRCGFFRNMFQNCSQNQQNPCQKKEEKKMEEKPNVNEEVITANAQYLAQCGFDFTKCYYWAKAYPQLSKEELLQLCLSSDKFLN